MRFTYANDMLKVWYNDGVVENLPAPERSAWPTPVYWYDTPAPPGTVKYCQHRPGYVTTDERLEQGTADPPSALFDVPFVKRMEKPSDLPALQLVRWSLSRVRDCNGQPYGYLMAEMADGRFWVVAYLLGDMDALGLPEWTKGAT